jgi:hypothetical protein
MKKMCVVLVVIGILFSGVFGLKAWWPDLWTPSNMQSLTKDAQLSKNIHELNLANNLTAQVKMADDPKELAYLQKQETQLRSSIRLMNQFIWEAKSKSFIAGLLGVGNSEDVISRNGQEVPVQINSYHREVRHVYLGGCIRVFQRGNALVATVKTIPVRRATLFTERKANDEEVRLWQKHFRSC